MEKKDLNMWNFFEWFIHEVRIQGAQYCLIFSQQTSSKQALYIVFSELNCFTLSRVSVYQFQFTLNNANMFLPWAATLNYIQCKGGLYYLMSNHYHWWALPLQLYNNRLQPAASTPPQPGIRRNVRYLIKKTKLFALFWVEQTFRHLEKDTSE